MSDRRPLDYAAAAEYLSITERHLRGLVSRGEVRSIKLGRLVRFLPEDLDRLLGRAA